MINIPPKPTTANEWLAYIEALHPKSIAMGLDRVNIVANKLALNPTFPIITVAGTNGKGSVCTMLSHVYVQAGYQVGCYTSPHLNRYNERVSVNLQAITDGDLCEAFAAVEAAREEVALTYFEMGTLAAMWHFCRQQLDIVILEVGLGGRLDAVNVFALKIPAFSKPIFSRVSPKNSMWSKSTVVTMLQAGSNTLTASSLPPRPTSKITISSCWRQKCHMAAKVPISK